MKASVIIFLFGFAATVAAAKTLRVPADYATIQAGINKAVNGDTVLVADNTYVENIDFLGKAITVASYYVIDGKTSHIQQTVIDGSAARDPNLGSVVRFVSGEDNRAVLCGFTVTKGRGCVMAGGEKAGGGIFILDSNPQICHNHVVYNVVENSDAGNTLGGGIYAGPFSRKELVLTGNTIAHNKVVSTSKTADVAGGGLCIYTDGIIVNNQINDNEVIHNGDGKRAALGGGLISVHQPTMTFLKLHDNEIKRNRVFSRGYVYGGGLDLIFTNTEFSNNKVSENVVDSWSGAYGGGMRILCADSTSHFANNDFSANSLVSGTNSHGGGLLLVQSTGLHLAQNKFFDNLATFGGGLYIHSSPGTHICENDIFRNKTEMYGGGLYSWLSNPYIANNLVYQNGALAGGGITIAEAVEQQALAKVMTGDTAGQENAVYVPGVVGLPDGGGQVVAATLGAGKLTQIVNNTIVLNESPDDGAGISSYHSNVVVFNTILWGNSRGVSKELGCWRNTITLSHSIVQGGQNNVYSAEGGSFEWGDNIFTRDPNLSWSDFRLPAGSDGIGRGTEFVEVDNVTYLAPTIDLRGHTRPDPVDNLIDLGALESAFESPTTHATARKTMPDQFLLSQNYPNPFNPVTTISFNLPAEERVSLIVYDLNGRKVARLIDGRLDAGEHRFTFNGANLVSGVYHYRLTALGQSQTRAMVLLK